MLIMLNFRNGSVFLDKCKAGKFSFTALLFLLLIFYTFMETRILWSLYLLFLIIIVFSRKRIVYEPLALILPLTIPLIWGFIMSFDDDLLNSVKGIFYLSVPVIMILIGFQFKRIFTAEDFLRSTVFLGTAVSIMFIILTLTRAGFAAFGSPMSESRFTVSSGSPAAILCLVTVLFSRHFGFDIVRKRLTKLLIIAVNLLAIWLFASRYFWVMLIIFLVVYGFKVISNRNLLVLSFIALISLLLLVISVKSNEELSGSNSIAYKFVHSLDEIRISNYETDREINTNYRGYESYRSLMTYADGTFAELILGGGYGKLIDLDASVLLDFKYWTEVPLVHNGFLFVLVKLGPIGLLLNLFFYLFVANIAFKKIKTPNRKEQFLAQLLIAAIIALFISNYVGAGMFTMEMTFLIITIGYLVRTLWYDKIPEKEEY